MNSYLPRFVIGELSRNPDKFIDEVMGGRTRPDLEPFYKQVETEVEAGRIRPIDPRQLIMNMVSMCIMPFIARPVFQFMMDMDKKEYAELMKKRKTEIAEFIISAIR